MIPPAPRNSSVAPMSSGATSWMLRLKKDLRRRMRSTRVGPRHESDPLDVGAEGIRGITVQGVMALEEAVLLAANMEGLVLRYGFLYGPGTWNEKPARPPSLHVDAAAHAALLALTRGAPG